MKKLLLFLLLATFAASEINSQTVVELTDAGTLQEKVPDYSNVTSLVVSGPINGTDLRYIREMAGIKLSGGPSQGVLSELDLSDARIVAGGDYYMYDYTSYEEFYTVNDEFGQYVFFNCPVLKYITLPSTLKKIGVSAFSSCPNLHKITVPESNENFYSDSGVLFSKADNKLIKYPQARNLRYYSVPAGIKVIGYDSMSNVLDLEIISLPEGLETIERMAFCFDKNITSIDIPSTVTSIGVSSFNYCSGLEAINVVDGNTVYASVDGVLYSKDMGTLVRCPINKSGSYNVPEGVTKLEEYAFSFCTKITSVSLPETITTLSDWSFDGCANMENVNIPATINYMGAGTFSDCRKLTSVHIPEGIKSMAKWLLYNCKSLVDLKIPATIKKIDDGALQGCELLEEFIVPDGVSVIEPQTFYGCVKLNSVTLPASVYEINAYAFMGCTGLKQLTVYATEPPTCKMMPFFQVPTGTCVLTVPYGTSELYKAANDWKNFANITEMEYNSIGNHPAINTQESYFTIDGKPLPAPQRGLNIIRSSDGTVKKVMK